MFPVGIVSILHSYKWLPYVIGLVGLLFVVWRIHTAGYDAGYAQAHGIAQAAEKAVMQRHARVSRDVAEIDLEAVVVTARKKETIRYAFTKIIRTTEPCDSADWLREYNEGVRAAGTGTDSPGADTGS
jgi:hypothetical protein